MIFILRQVFFLFHSFHFRLSLIVPKRWADHSFDGVGYGNMGVYIVYSFLFITHARGCLQTFAAKCGIILFKRHFSYWAFALKCIPIERLMGEIYNIKWFFMSFGYNFYWLSIQLIIDSIHCSYKTVKLFIQRIALNTIERWTTFGGHRTAIIGIPSVIDPLLKQGSESWKFWHK